MRMLWLGTCTRVREKHSVWWRSQSETPSNSAAHWERETVRYRVGQREYIYVLCLYIHLCVCTCVHRCGFTRLIQQDRQKIFICKQPRTLVCRMERKHKKRLEGGGWWGRKREREHKRQTGTPGTACARELVLYVPEWVYSSSLLYPCLCVCVWKTTDVYKRVWITYKLRSGGLWLYVHVWHVFIHTAWDALTLNSCLQKASQKQLACLSSLQTKFRTHTWLLKQEIQLAILHWAKPHTQQIFFSCLSSITLSFFIPGEGKDTVFLHTDQGIGVPPTSPSLG